uniref:Uncharacterized protein n=1 Tax=Cutibacterium phage vB_CacS-HV1 TaxID=3236917 RepID=A0AB39CFF3_9CAUD
MLRSVTLGCSSVPVTRQWTVTGSLDAPGCFMVAP